MILPLAALFFFIVCYFLFIKGWLFKLIIITIFPIAARLLLVAIYPPSAAICLTIAGISLSWALMIPLTITLLALLTSKD